MAAINTTTLEETSLNVTTNSFTTTSDSTSAEIALRRLSESVSLDDIEKLQYDIYRYSSYSTNYMPENIMVDCPADQSSRWSAYNNNPPQYLTLRLRRPAVVQKIKFGKFEKSHVCNIKKFRIFGGMDEDHMELLLEAGLRNDHIPETFHLRCFTGDDRTCIPILYLQIMPLLSWGPTFNYSIWYVELHGQDDPMYTSFCLREYNKLREHEIIRLCLKHFRQQGYHMAYKALQEQTNVNLEHTSIREFHKCLVEQGDFEKTEQFIHKCIDDGLMDGYLKKQNYKHIWHLQQTAHGSSSSSCLQPGNRGGHQLVMDLDRRLMYLYGGWDGFQDLSDLWQYDLNENMWTLLCAQSELCNGPTPRSCHKMVFDPISENIFMIGRYLDNSIRTSDYIKSDFYLYDTRARTWVQICDDTSQVGGPQLVYDHQLCLDVEKNTIYVFGGKVLTVTDNTSNETEYSGLFSYHIATNTWTQILVDSHHPTASQPDVLSIKSRITHCMVFHNINRKLYIYGGQRGKLDLFEFFSYDVDTQAIEVLNKHTDYTNCSTTLNAISCSSSNASSGGGGGGGCKTTPYINFGNDCGNEPSPVFTLRATIDCERNEIYIFSSLCKSKDRRDIQLADAPNSFWVYSIATHTWTRIYTYRYSSCEAINMYKNFPLEPCPRYAHQFVYDNITKLHYLFGGNPGKIASPQLRLDDFWILELKKPSRTEILTHCKYLIRKLRYEEMAQTEPYKAVIYLRKSIAEVIDHNDSEELQKFHKLATLLFKTMDDETVFNDYSRLVSIATDNEDKSCSSLSHSSDKSSCMKLIGSDASYETSLTDVSEDSRGCKESFLLLDSTSLYNKLQRGQEHEGSSNPNDKLRNRRAFLFNKLMRLLPSHMVQPEKNLSDFAFL